jgi:hypothetical protein
MANATEEEYSVQFRVPESMANDIRDYTKVDSLGPAALSIIRKVIENWKREKAQEAK